MLRRLATYALLCLAAMVGGMVATAGCPSPSMSSADGGLVDGALIDVLINSDLLRRDVGTAHAQDAGSDLDRRVSALEARLKAYESAKTVWTSKSSGATAWNSASIGTTTLIPNLSVSVPTDVGDVLFIGLTEGSVDLGSGDGQLADLSVYLYEGSAIIGNKRMRSKGGRAGVGVHPAVNGSVVGVPSGSFWTIYEPKKKGTQTYEARLWFTGTNATYAVRDVQLVVAKIKRKL